MGRIARQARPFRYRNGSVKIDYMTDKLTFKNPAALARLLRIQGLLRQEPSTLSEIAAVVHISVRYAREYLSNIRERRQAYVHSYRQDRVCEYATWKPLYAWGTKKDAKEPDTSARAKQERRRARINADPLAKASELAKRRAKAIKPFTDWTSSWIPRKPSV